MQTGDARNRFKEQVFAWIAAGVLLLLLMLSGVIIVAQADGLTHSATLHGPFQADPVSGSQKLSADIPVNRPLPCCTIVRTDANGSESASNLRLWIGAREITPPHTMHETLRHGGPGFSHWGQAVHFVLPPGAPNTSATTIRIEYPLEPAKPFLVVPPLTALLALLLFGMLFVRADAEGRRVILRRTGNVALALGAVLALGLMVLQLGLIRTAQVSYGPFTSDGSQRLQAPLRDAGPLACCIYERTDAHGSETASELRLWINGKEILPAHTIHETLRHGGPGFSHWGDAVYFALPSGVQNTPDTQVRVEFPLRPRLIPALALVFATLSLLASLHGRELAQAFRMGRPPIGRTWTDFLANLALVLGVMITLLIAVMEVGLVQQSREMRGPLVGDTGPGAHRLWADLETGRPLACCTIVRTDSNGHETESEVRLWINDGEIQPAHTLHETLRQGGPGFSDWDNVAYFALPAGVPNTAQTRVRVVYPLNLPLLPTFAIPLITGLLAYRLHGRRIRQWLSERSVSQKAAFGLPYWILFAAGWGALAAAVVYVAVIIWGVVAGDALAPAAPFRSDAAKNLVERFDPATPLFLLVLALVGVMVGWLAKFSPPARANIKRQELAVLRWTRRYGLFVITAFFVASVGATWAGIIRHGSNSTILGLVPFFDAGGYFADANSFLRDGAWSEFSSRRPLPAAFRTSLFVLSDLRFAIMMLIQTVLLAVTAYFATMSVARWRGVWAGVVFLALTYILLRTQLTTSMTEPLGLTVALCAIPFLVESLRRSSRSHGLIAVFLFSAAIWMRPGAMFVIPALAVWFGVSFGYSRFAKAMNFALACGTIVAMLAFDTVLGKLFGSFSPGNFAYTLCGLSIGGNWSSCLTRYAGEIATTHVDRTDATLVHWLYAKGFANLRQDPGPLLNIIVHEPLRFLGELPTVMLRGYTNMPIPSGFPLGLALCATLVLLSVSLPRRWAEVSFWILIFGGLVSSATIFYFTDGVRAFSVVYPLVALFVARAFATPSSIVVSSAGIAHRELRRGRLAIAGVLACLLVIPPVGRLLYATPHLPRSSPETAVVGGVDRGTGVLVVADSEPLPRGSPSIHFGRFAAFVRNSGVEQSQGLVTPYAPSAPFGFLAMPLYDRSGTISLIVPPEIVLRREVPAWRVRYEDWHPSGRLFGKNWYNVTAAEPIYPQTTAR